MRRGFALLLALCLVFAMVVGLASSAGAKPRPPDTGVICLEDRGETCQTWTSDTGTGEDFYAFLGNKCDGANTVCHTELQLIGTFNDVVIDRANECTNGATCTIVVDYRNSTFNSIQFRDGAFRSHLSGITVQDSCDATSVCVKTPPPQPPTTSIDSGGVCIEVQGTTGPCVIAGTTTGTGQNLNLIMGNKCSVAVNCSVEIWLEGSFNNVVVDRANDCSNGATCTLTLHNNATINSLQIEDATFRTFGTTIRDRCTATAVCTKSP